MSRPRLYLVDDHRLFLESLASMLATECDVLGIATSVSDLLAALPNPAIECVLLDLLMPHQNGLDALPAIKAKQPSLKVLVVTMLADRTIAGETLARGADGFVPKDAGSEELLRAINTVLDGRRYLSPLLPKTSHGAGLRAAHPALIRLTPRQHEIVMLLGAGRSYAEIADELGISRSTFTFHKNHILDRLGVTSDSALKHFALLLFVDAPPRGARRQPDD